MLLNRLAFGIYASLYFAACICRREFCSQLTAFTMNDDNLFDAVVSPGYPDTYTTVKQCRIAIKVDVSKPFTVTIASKVEDCNSSLPYDVSLKTEEAPLNETSTCSSSRGVDRHITTFRYTGDEYKVKKVKIHLYLLKGSGNGFSISILGK